MVVTTRARISKHVIDPDWMCGFGAVGSIPKRVSSSTKEDAFFYVGGGAGPGGHVNSAGSSNLKHAAYLIGPTGTQRARLNMF